MVNNISEVGKNVVKCVWIVWILRIARVIARDASVLLAKKLDTKKGYWVCYLAIVLLFALGDVLTAGMPFWFAITYIFLFYPIFMVVDYLTEYGGVKSFFMIMGLKAPLFVTFTNLTLRRSGSSDFATQ